MCCQSGRAGPEGLPAAVEGGEGRLGNLTHYLVSVEDGRTRRATAVNSGGDDANPRRGDDEPGEGGTARRRDLGRQPRGDEAQPMVVFRGRVGLSIVPAAR